MASRTVMIIGSVLARAATRMTEILRAFLAGEEGVPIDAVTLEGDGVKVTGSDRELSFTALAGRYVARHGELHVLERHQPREDLHFDEATYEGAAYPVYGWGCDVVEVTVDPDTLEIKPERFTSVCDVGRAIHPVLCIGQLEGGGLQALAWGYLEEVKMLDGRYQNDRLATCLIPTASDVPAMDVSYIENPASCGPFGAKGVGELPMDGGAPAIVQAIENATGIVPSSIPATPERLLEWLQSGAVVDEESAG